MGKKFIIFGTDMSSSVNIDNKNKDILILGEGPTKGLDDTTLTTEAKYLVILRNQEKICIKSHNYGNSSFLFVNATKIYHFKSKDFEIKDYAMWLGFYN